MLLALKNLSDHEALRFTKDTKESQRMNKLLITLLFQVDEKITQQYKQAG